MEKVNVYISDYPDKLPEWYWVSGLHDACITCVQTFCFPFDYNRFTGEKSNYNRNLLSLKIDASGALFDVGVREIRLFNYNVLSEDIVLEGREKIWWLSDRLTEKDAHYILEIDMQDFDSDPKEFTYKVRFERAEVDRY